MKISASLYAAEGLSVAEIAVKLDALGVDYIHVDCNDDLQVFDDVAQIRRVSRTPVDFHLIAPNPEPYYEPLARHRVEWVTFQHETLAQMPEIPLNFPARLGVAFTPQTPPTAFLPYRSRFDFIVVMSGMPGKSGGKFNADAFRRIREFSRLYPEKSLHVDGGVNAEVAYILRSLGVEVAVSGSFLMRAASWSAAAAQLDNERYPGHFRVRDFMLAPDELPVFNVRTARLYDVLETMERFRYGFALAVDDAGKLEGLVGNADVRRALMRYLERPERIAVKDVINPRPMTVSPDDTLPQLLEKLRKTAVFYLPVVEDEKLAGGLVFHKLIKGE
ncbi:MAG: CBS domain-containing protein [Bacteroidia bacterium]|nr:CBS domain-containing protein [Bacteroidia bacterium]